MYWVYILYSKDLDKYYTGQTSEISNRIQSHLDEKSFYTSRAHDWELVFAQEMANRTEALTLEKKIKHAKSRKSILRYINNPRNKAALFLHNGE